MSGVANFFKRKDKLDYNRFVRCPLPGSSGKQYVMEKGSHICPCCGEDLEGDHKFLIGHQLSVYSEG